MPTIIIIGSGIIGMLLAKLLSRAHCKIILVTNQTKPNLDLRYSALSKASIALLQAADLWGKIQAVPYGYYTNMEVWDELGTGQIKFAAREYNEPCLGYVVANAVLQEVLHASVVAEPLIEIVYGDCQELAITCESATVTINTAHGSRQLQGSLVIGADGANSWVRARAEIPLTTCAYDQTGLTAMVQTSKPHGHTARQVFAKNFSLAFLPLNGEHDGSIILSAGNDANYSTLTDAELAAVIGEKLEHSYGAITITSVRQSYPLRFLHAQSYIQPRFALVGDAAHVIHPLAGLGLNLGLHDVKLLQAVLISACKSNYDLGAELLLRKYEYQAQAHNARMLHGVDALYRLFATDNPGVVRVRSAGLDLVNANSWLKWLLVGEVVG